MQLSNRAKLEKTNRDLIFFRCEGTAQTGFGHVSRCLALAEALEELGLRCIFLGKFEAGTENLMRSSGFEYEEIVEPIGSIQDLNFTIETLKRSHAVGVVVDSYYVSDSYIEVLKRDGAPVLLIDDFKRLDRYDCSVLLNFTVNAPNLMYPCSKKVCLLGADYFLARRKLRLLRRKIKPCSKTIQRVLIAIGGLDALNLSKQVIVSLLRIEQKLSVHVVVGKSYKGAKELSALVENFYYESCVYVQLADLSDEFSWADMCICGGGLTKYEAAYLGLPTAVLSQNVDQAMETVEFINRGLAFNLGLATEIKDSELSTRLMVFLDNQVLHESLNHNCLEFFSEDPTLSAAKSFMENVKQ